MEAPEEFLVRIDNDRFMVDFDGKYVTLSDTPSHSRHLTYAAADSWCQRLRRRGYPQAVVTDIAGNVMTYASIKMALQVAAEVELLPTSCEVLDAMTSTEYRRRMLDPAFRVRVDQLEQSRKAKV